MTGLVEIAQVGLKTDDSRWQPLAPVSRDRFPTNVFAIISFGENVKGKRYRKENETTYVEVKSSLNYLQQVPIRDKE